MRNFVIAFAAVTSLVGCSAAGRESHGTTAATYKGPVQVVFTNASPDTMCGLYMSFDQESEYGDNWLPANGLRSGQSVKFWVKQGTYKARWDTCRKASSPKFYAGTMTNEMAINIGSQQTQIYAYVADSVAPTKRAPTLGRPYQLVRFQGMAVEPFGHARVQTGPRVAQAEDKPSEEMSARERAIVEGSKKVEKPSKLGASEFVDKQAKKR